jgi:hypothetical protein
MKTLWFVVLGAPLAGFAYLTASKQEISFEGGAPHLEKRGARKAKEGLKAGLDGVTKVAEVAGGVKGKAAATGIDKLREIVAKAKDTVNGVSESASDAMQPSDNVGEVDLVDADDPVRTSKESEGLS